MSRTSLRKRVGKILVRNLEAKEDELLSEASRRILTSSSVSQVLVIRNRELTALWESFLAMVGPEATKFKAQYISELKTYIFGLGKTPPTNSPLNSSYFKELLERRKLVWGKNVVYLPFAYTTVGKKLDEFNVSFYDRVLGSDGSAQFSKEKKNTHIDHGVDDTGVAALAGIPGVISAGARSSKTGSTESFIDSVLFNLNSVNPVLHNKYKDLIINWDQFVDKRGRIKFDIGILLSPTGSSRNLGKAATEKAEFNAVVDVIENTILGLDLGTVHGSSSIRDKVETAIVAPFADKLKGKAVVKTKKSKLKTKTKVREKLKSNRRSLDSENARYRLRDPRTGRFISKEQAFKPTTLTAILNAKLPEVVAKNMTPPALVYRTGRFARSTKVTDIRDTQQGYPSIAYTYMKYPYQTFELGFAQGSPQRDPRALIDKSIREILSEIMEQRFYTRRV